MIHTQSCMHPQHTCTHMQAHTYTQHIRMQICVYIRACTHIHTLTKTAHTNKHTHRYVHTRKDRQTDTHIHNNTILYTIGKWL